MKYVPGKDLVELMLRVANIIRKILGFSDCDLSLVAVILNCLTVGEDKNEKEDD